MLTYKTGDEERSKQEIVEAIWIASEMREVAASELAAIALDEMI